MVNKMSKVSVLVPVYNVEKYLKECLDSISNQTLKDIEIICINDGSTDSSLAILNEYALRDNRFKVVNKENSGYGASLNIALSMAQSKYIGIIEPDDYIEPEMLECFYEKAEEHNLDFIKGDYYTYETIPIIKNTLFVSFDKSRVYDKVIKPIDYNEVFNGSASIWSAVYNSEFLKKNNICFLETPGASFQDTSFWIRVLFSANRALFINKAFNHYRIDNELSSVKSNSKVFCICDEIHFLEKLYKNDAEKRLIINTLKIDKYTWNYNRLNKKGKKLFSKIYFNELWSIIKNKEYIEDLLPVENVVSCIKNLYKCKLVFKIFSIQRYPKYIKLCFLGIHFKFKYLRNLV